MDGRTRKKWLPLAFLAAALLLWAAIFAAGAYLQLGADQPQHDLRKPLIIMGCMLAFVASWSLALWFRRRRRPKNP